jgi:hypothetical protein
MFVNIEDKNEIQVVDTRTLTAITTWALPNCDGPGGIGFDRSSQRIFSACGSAVTVVTDATSGKNVAQFPIGGRPDALGFDPSQKLIYVPGGAAPGTVTVAHEDSPDKYTVIATVNTMVGARTIAVDATRHRAYTFTPENGPAPANATPPAGGRGRGAQGPQIAAWLFVIGH